MMSMIKGSIKKSLDLKPVHVIHQNADDKMVYLTRELKTRTRALQKSRD